MMYTYAATALLAAAIAATGTWKIEEWRYGAKEKARAEQELVNVRQSAAKAIRATDNIIVAQNAATIREANLRRDAAGTRAALVGLSGATAQALRDADTSQNACLERAATLGELLNTMADAGGQIAEKAGHHASDIKTLMEGWPK